MWDLPRPGLEPMSPALAGGYLTTAPPGKSLIVAIINSSHVFTFLGILVHLEKITEKILKKPPREYVS